MSSSPIEYPQSYYGMLAILSQGPMSGYDIRKILEGPEIFFWKESYGNIYPMLRKLEMDGLVDKKDSYVKKKKRVMYHLNSRGTEELTRWLALPVSLNRFRVEILMKLRFGQAAGVDTMIGHVSDYGRTAQGELKEVEHLVEAIRNTGDTLETDLRLITVKYFQRLKESNLIWCSDALEILEKWKNRENSPTSDLTELSGEDSVFQVPVETPPLIE